MIDGRKLCDTVVTGVARHGHQECSYLYSLLPLAWSQPGVPGRQFQHGNWKRRSWGIPKRRSAWTGRESTGVVGCHDHTNWKPATHKGSSPEFLLLGCLGFHDEGTEGIPEKNLSCVTPTLQAIAVIVHSI